MRSMKYAGHGSSAANTFPVRCSSRVVRIATVNGGSFSSSSSSSEITKHCHALNVSICVRRVASHDAGVLESRALRSVALVTSAVVGLAKSSCASTGLRIGLSCDSRLRRPSVDLSSLSTFAILARWPLLRSGSRKHFKSSFDSRWATSGPVTDNKRPRR